MPETAVLLAAELVAPELAATLAAPLSFGGYSIGMSAASVLGTVSLVAAPVGLSCPLRVDPGAVQ